MFGAGCPPCVGHHINHNPAYSSTEGNAIHNMAHTRRRRCLQLCCFFRHTLCVLPVLSNFSFGSRVVTLGCTCTCHDPRCTDTSLTKIWRAHPRSSVRGSKFPLLCSSRQRARECREKKRKIPSLNLFRTAVSVVARVTEVLSARRHRTYSLQ